MARVQLVFHSGQDVLKTYIPKALFDAVRERAKSEGVPYRHFICRIIERQMTKEKRLKRKVKTSRRH